MTMAAARKKAPKRKRPGMPRKTDNLNRITLRVGKGIASQMNKACDDLDLTQRDFVEQAIREYCEQPTSKDPLPKPDEDVYRTGMWIDPGVVALMDKREAREGITQRALVEQALKLKLERLAAR